MILLLNILITVIVGIAIYYSVMFRGEYLESKHKKTNKKNYDSDWFAGLKHAEDLGLDEKNRPVAKEYLMRNEYIDESPGFQSGVIDYIEYTKSNI